MTEEQRAVLAHVVVDPEAWWAHAVKHFGVKLATEHLVAKVARHKPSFEASVKRGGHRPRAEREQGWMA